MYQPPAPGRTLSPLRPTRTAGLADRLGFADIRVLPGPFDTVVATRA
jgi:hypothetical protein